MPQGAKKVEIQAVQPGSVIVNFDDIALWESPDDSDSGNRDSWTKEIVSQSKMIH